MTRRRRAVGLLLALGVLSGAEAAPGESRALPEPRLSFVSNVGHVEADTAFQVFGPEHRLDLARGELRLVAHGSAAAPPVVLRTRFLGAAPVLPQGREPLPGRVNDYRGTDPARWVTAAPTWASVIYPGVYEGIDLVYGSRGGRIKSDWLVAPGADPARIRLAYSGMESLELTPEGALLLRTSAGELREDPPYAYQDIAGRTVEVPVAYQLLSGGRVGFSLGAYDRTVPLVIDPDLAWLTYLGGQGEDDVIYGLEVDGNGDLVATGLTRSPDFPVAGPALPRGGGMDIHVTKLDGLTGQVIYATYLGGSGRDFLSRVALDAAGNAYVSGWTTSANFPTTSGVLHEHEFLGGGDDIVLAKLSPAGALVYSTYLGGSGDDESFGVGVDARGCAYVTGRTSSSDFPHTAGSNSSLWDDFVLKVNADATAVEWSFLWGSAGGIDHPQDLVLDAADNVWVAGMTAQPNFPTTPGAPASTHGGGAFDVFLTGVRADGTGLLYSTYLGGSGSDEAMDMTLGADGLVHVVGRTTSADLPTTAGAVQPVAGGGGQDGFLLSVDPRGNGAADVRYLSYVGQAGTDRAHGVAESEGLLVVVGSTDDPAFPVQGSPLQDLHAGGEDAFVWAVDPRAPGAAGLVYASFLGGALRDDGRRVAAGSLGAVFVGGFTESTGLATPGAFQPTIGGGRDGFLARFELGDLPRAPLPALEESFIPAPSEPLSAAFHLGDETETSGPGVTPCDDPRAPPNCSTILSGLPSGPETILTPFKLSGRFRLGCGPAFRSLSGGRIAVTETSLVPFYGFGSDPLIDTTPDAADGEHVSLLQRIAPAAVPPVLQGDLLDYEISSVSWSYQGGTRLTSFRPLVRYGRSSAYAFRAPPVGDQVVDIVEDRLASVCLRITSSEPGVDVVGMRFQVTAIDAGGVPRAAREYARFASRTPIAPADPANPPDPATLTGFLAEFDALGRGVFSGETLVWANPDFRYRIDEIYVEIDPGPPSTANNLLRVDIDAQDDPAPLFIDAGELSACGKVVLDVAFTKPAARIRGEIQLERDLADLALGAGPRVTSVHSPYQRYRRETNAGAGDWTAYSIWFQPLRTSTGYSIFDDGPVAYDFPCVRTGRWRQVHRDGSAHALLSWDTTAFGPGAAATGGSYRWPDLGPWRAPVDPLGPSPTGFDADSYLYLDAQDPTSLPDPESYTETVDLQAEMGFVRRRVQFRGCLTTARIRYGRASLIGRPGPDPSSPFVDERGQARSSVPGLTGSYAIGIFRGPSGDLEIAAGTSAGQANLYREGGYLVRMTQGAPGDPLDAGDFQDQYLYWWHDEAARDVFDVQPGRDQAITAATHSYLIGKASARIRVRNAPADVAAGAPPFRALRLPRMSIGRPWHYDHRFGDAGGASGGPGRYGAVAYGEEVAADTHVLDIHGLAGDQVNLWVWAQVRENPDDTGRWLWTGFPTLFNVPLSTGDCPPVEITLDCLPRIDVDGSPACEYVLGDLSPDATYREDGLPIPLTGELSLVQTPPPGTPLATGSHAVDLSVVRTDAATGDQTVQAVCVTVVAVHDVDPPVIACDASLIPIEVLGPNGTAPTPPISATVSDCSPWTTSQSPAVGTPLLPGDHQVVVVATDASGNSASCSTTVRVGDTSPPLPGTVNDGTGADIDLQTSSTSLAANWSGFSDPESGIAGYEWAIGTTPGGSEVLAFTGASGTSASRTGLTLVHGRLYYVTVRATNGAGLQTTAVSDGVAINDPIVLGLAESSVQVGEGAGSVTLTVLRSGNPGLDASVTSFTFPSSAVGGLDYTPRVGVLSLPAGSTSQTFSIPIVDDALVENDEQFFVGLDDPSPGALVLSGAVPVTIVDDDGSGGAVLSMGQADAGVSEADGLVTLTVVRSGDLSSAALVDYFSFGLSALPGQDFAGGRGTVYFLPQQTSASFSVLLEDDALVEGNEAFGVALENPGGGTLGAAQVTIVYVEDDDGGGAIFEMAVAEAQFPEASPFAVLNVVRRGDLSSAALVEFFAFDVTARAGQDYTATAGTLQFAPQQASGTIAVPLLNDTIIENEELWGVELTNPGGGVLGPQRSTLVSIVDDDGGAAVFSMAVAETLVSEADGSVTLTVLRSGDLSGQALVDVLTFDITAEAGQDYAASPATLEFAPQQTSATFSVQLLDDGAVENDELFGAALENPGGGSLGAQTVTLVSVSDDDGGSAVFSFAGGLTATSESAGAVEVLVTRAGDLASPALVDYFTHDIPAEALVGRDYTAASGTLSFAAGEASARIEVAILADTELEPDEIFGVVLENPGGGTLGSPSTHVVQILDEPTPTAQLFAPPLGTPLPGASVPFEWDDPGAPSYRLLIGTAPGLGDLFDQVFPSGVSNTIVSGLPVDGSSVWVGLGTERTPGGHDFEEYAFTAYTVPAAQLFAPPLGTPLPGASVPFEWDDPGAQSYRLLIGTAPGLGDLFDQVFPSGVSNTIVSGLPVDGSSVWVGLGTERTPGGHDFEEYAFTAYTVPAAQLFALPLGRPLPGASVPFEWDDPGAQSYRLLIGTAPGLGDLYDQVFPSGVGNTIVSGLPVDGSSVWVGLGTERTPGGHDFEEYAFTAYTVPAAQLFAPPLGRPLLGASVPFEWDDPGAQSYRLRIGTAPGLGDLHDQIYPSGVTNVTVSGLPVDGSSVWVGLGTERTPGGHDFEEYAFTAADD